MTAALTLSIGRNRSIFKRSILKIGSQITAKSNHENGLTDQGTLGAYFAIQLFDSIEVSLAYLVATG